MLTIYNPIGTSFVCGFQLSNKKEFILYLFEIQLVDPLTLIIIISLFNPYINITSQSSLQLLFCYYLFLYLQFIQLTSLWFDPGLAGLFITSTLLHLEEDINSLVVSIVIMECLRHQIKTKRKVSQNKQDISTKTEEAGTLNKIHLLTEIKNLK